MVEITRSSVGLATLVTVGLVIYVARSDAAAGSKTGVDAIIVLAGGVSDQGQPHETVMRRLQEAANVYRQQVERGDTAPAIICNGGGTTHKPKWVDAAGYAVPEAALMGRKLTSLGVKAADIYVEGYSDDTIGASTAFSRASLALTPDPAVACCTQAMLFSRA